MWRSSRERGRAAVARGLAAPETDRGNGHNHLSVPRTGLLANRTAFTGPGTSRSPGSSGCGTVTDSLNTWWHSWNLISRERRSYAALAGIAWLGQVPGPQTSTTAGQLTGYSPVPIRITHLRCWRHDVV